MAASMLPSQKQEDFKDQFLICSLCTEQYDNNEHQAKMLPCLHSYCKSCLQQHAGKRPKFNCPDCHTEVRLANGTIDSLPNNFIVENLKDYQDTFNLAVLCGSCDEGNQAFSFCQDCGYFLCQRCVDDHHRLRPLRHHKLSSPLTKIKKAFHPMMEQQCMKHPTKPLDLYCKEVNCKVSACASCGHIDHRGHEIVDLTAAIDEIVVTIRQASTGVAIRNQELTKKRTAVDTRLKTLTDSFNEKERLMYESVQKLHALIASRHYDAHFHLKHLYQSEMNRLTEMNESINLLATQMTSACEFANKACDMNHTQLLTTQDQIMERLDELRNTQQPVTESDKTDFILTPKHHSSIAQIADYLQHLCDVDWITRTPVYKHEQKNIIESKPALPKGIQDHKRQVGQNQFKLALKGHGYSKPQVDPSQCRIQLGLPGALGFYFATVQTVDFNGQLITTGGAKLKVEQSGGEIFLGAQDNRDGTYTFGYDPGYGPIYVKINGTPMEGSPFHHDH